MVHCSKDVVGNTFIRRVEGERDKVRRGPVLKIRPKTQPSMMYT